jgi:hypothetical protein
MPELSVQLYPWPVRAVNHFGQDEACGFVKTVATVARGTGLIFKQKMAFAQTQRA